MNVGKLRPGKECQFYQGHTASYRKSQSSPKSPGTDFVISTTVADLGTPRSKVSDEESLSMQKLVGNGALPPSLLMEEENQP